MSIEALLEGVAVYSEDAEVEIVRKAWALSARVHAGKVRRNGEPHIRHPIEVARILLGLRMDVDTLAAALLHEAIETGRVTREDLLRDFGPVVAELIAEITRIGKLQFRSKEEEQAENFRKALLAMSRDIRVMLVKLADRLHNLRTLDALEPEIQALYAQENLDIYIPIANRLGLGDIKSEMEDLCLRYLHPDVHESLCSAFAQSAVQRQAYIERNVKFIHDTLGSNGLQCEVMGRSKGLMSTWRKMVAQKIQFEQIYDLLAFRVLVDDLGSCYAALGYIHGLYTPLPHRIKDYIAMPKGNGYRSLHTTVIGPEGQRIEIQIRTRDMDRIAVNGVAAHWKYKEGHLALSPDDFRRMVQLRELIDSARDVQDPGEFLEAVKIDLFVQDVYVFTPRGEVKVFPAGATALDFAYAVHTEVGNHCVGARIDGRIVPLKYELQSGDSIEIMTRPDQRPSRDWLRIARCGHSLAKIRKTLREEEEAQGVEVGRDMLEAELRKRGRNLAKLIREGALKQALRALDQHDPDQLFLSIARGQLTPTKVGRELAPDAAWDPPREEPTPESLVTRHKARSESPVLINGEQDLFVTYARCCNPLPGEPVEGYITQGHGISVHAIACPQLLGMDPERRIAVQWDARVKTQHLGGLRIVCLNRPGLLANISGCCESSKINIHRLEVHPMEDQQALCEMEVAIHDVKELSLLMHKLERIRGVNSVTRTRG